MKDLNIGLIGGGLIGRTHAIAYRMMKAYFAEETANVHLKVVAERDEETAKETAKRLGIPQWTADWKELLRDDEIDLIIVAVPNYMHREFALETIRHRKNILCEKPLAMNASEAMEILTAAREADVRHGIGFNYRKAPAVLLIKKWIDDGRLGKIVSFRSSFIQDWGLDKNGPLSWRFDKKLAGSGSLGDLGSHVLDMARFLVGDISEVVGTAATHVTQRALGGGGLGRKTSGGPEKMGNVDVDDISDVLVRFENGAQGNFVASRLASGKKNHFDFEVYGMGGAVFFDWERPNEVLLSTFDTPNERSGFTRVLTGGFDHPYGASIWPIQGMGIGFGETFAVQLYEMVKSIREGSGPSPNFEDGWRVNQLLDAIQRSVENNRWEKVG